MAGEGGRKGESRMWPAMHDKSLTTRSYRKAASEPTLQAGYTPRPPHPPPSDTTRRPECRVMKSAVIAAGRSPSGGRCSIWLLTMTGNFIFELLIKHHWSLFTARFGCVTRRFRCSEKTRWSTIIFCFSFSGGDRGNLLTE